MASDKKKLLILTDWYLPAVKAGGPVRSVSAIVNALKSHYDISILTSDRDVGDIQAFAGITVDRWLQRESYRVQYVSPDRLNAQVKHSVKKGYDSIYLNSFFSKNFTVAALRALSSKDKKKVVLAPRGMLSAGALGLKSFKKKTFLALAKTVGLYRGISWHASTELESEEIRAVFPKAEVKAIENLAACTPCAYAPKKKEAESLHLVFVSRISPKKNLRYLLDVLDELNRASIRLDIYGPIEDESYWSSCQSVVSRHSSITYKGVLQPMQLQETLMQYDAFVLPTLNENFGHIILEALSSSLPLVLSNNTPWQSLQEKGVGYDLDLDQPERWKEVILELLEMDDERYSEYRKNAWNYANSKLDQQELVQDYIDLFD